MNLKKIKGLLIIFCMLFILLFISNTGFAFAPYNSYIYNFWGEAVPAPHAYVPSRLILGSDLEIDGLSNPRDLYIDNNNHIYLVDTGNHRIIHLDENWQLERIIDSYNYQGQKENLRNPEGIFVKDSSDIYIADTENNRIIVLDNEGNYKRDISSPEEGEGEGILPDDYVFRPRNLVVDDVGRIYVVAKDEYNGLMLFDQDGNFDGYLGAPRVTPSVADVFWRSIATEEQRRRTQLFLPTAFSNLDIDDDGFIFGIIRSGFEVSDGPVRRLNPAGDDTLRRQGFDPPGGDVPGVWTPLTRFVDVNAGKEGIYSILDQNFGRVYTYDRNGNLLYIFGGRGVQKGLFRVPVSMERYKDDKIVVLDSYLNQLTVFTPTKYAELIHDAIYYYNEGLFSRSIETWHTILKYNKNYDIAYGEIGKGLYIQNEYQEAMQMLRLGQNRDYYSRAWENKRRDLLAENIQWIVLSLIIMILVVIVIGKFRTSLNKYDFKNKLSVNNKLKEFGIIKKLLEQIASLKYALYLIFHPFGGFWDLKYQNKGNLMSAIILLILTSFSYIFIRQYTGFIFNPLDLSELNIYFEILTIVVPFLVWCGVNWAFTTLMAGKGSFKDIIIASSYALTPLIVINIPTTVISNYLTMQEGNLYYFFLSFAVFWFVFLLFSGTMITHEYEIAQSIFTIILIIVGMVLVFFLGLVFFVLFDQIISFFSDIYIELSFR